MVAVRQALLSVTDKTGLVGLAQGLVRHGVRLLSTGGTAKVLMQAGLPLREVSDYTGFPEMLDGRVKTLQPKIHGGILAMRDRPEHMETLAAHGIEPIDMVVVNLYAFEKTVADPGCRFEDAIENIDIGGPALIRAAAKNHAHVVVVTDPQDYEPVLREMDDNAGRVSAETRLRLATKAFCLTHRYDGAVCRYLESR